MQDLISQIMLFFQQVEIPASEPPGFFESNIRSFVGWAKWISIFILPFAIVALLVQVISNKKNTSRLRYVVPAIVITCLLIILLTFTFQSLNTVTHTGGA